MVSKQPYRLHVGDLNSAKSGCSAQCSWSMRKVPEIKRAPMVTAAPTPLICATVLRLDSGGRHRCPKQFEVLHFTTYDMIHVVTYSVYYNMIVTYNMMQTVRKMHVFFYGRWFMKF